jgi:hypothetical protein
MQGVIVLENVKQACIAIAIRHMPDNVFIDFSLEHHSQDSVRRAARDPIEFGHAQVGFLNVGQSGFFSA